MIKKSFTFFYIKTAGLLSWIAPVHNKLIIRILQGAQDTEISY